MIRAVTVDALGTLVFMRPPGPSLREELRRVGVEVSEREAAAAFAAEIRYYLAHHVEGSDRESLAALRDRCAGVLREALGLEGLELPLVRRAMLAALRFEPFPDAAPALSELRSRGLRLVVASNWDCSLPTVLERVGLGPLLDGVMSSGVAGATKPAAALFRAALELAGAEPGEALHVGDSLDNDVAGALALGMDAVLIARGDARAPAARVPVIDSLARLPPLVLDR